MSGKCLELKKEISALKKQMDEVQADRDNLRSEIRNLRSELQSRGAGRGNESGKTVKAKSRDSPVPEPSNINACEDNTLPPAFRPPLRGISKRMPEDSSVHKRLVDRDGRIVVLSIITKDSGITVRLNEDFEDWFSSLGPERGEAYETIPARRNRKRRKRNKGTSAEGGVMASAAATSDSCGGAITKKDLTFAAG